MNYDRVEELWDSTMLFLNASGGHNHSSLNALFSTIQTLDLTEEELILQTGSLYTKDWIERFLARDIVEALWAVSGRQLSFRIVFREAAPTAAPPKTAAPAALPVAQPPTGHALLSQQPVSQAGTPTSPAVPAMPTTPAVPTVTAGATTGIEPATQTHPSQPGEKTFESFVVGESNSVAFSMALQVAKTPGYIMNPLFIYGKSGLGKTHLLLSIQHYVKDNIQGMKIVYVPTSDLIHEYSQSARFGDFSDFNLKYFSADLLLLDDVQSLEGKIETTNTVFDIFNLLRSNNKQVVLSADRAPNEINLHDRYLSRFTSGGITDVQPPSSETKLTIFKSYLDYCSLRFERPDIRELIRQDVEEYVVSLSGSNIRELEGAATSLVWSIFSSNKHRYLPLTVEEAAPIVAHHFRRIDPKSISIETILKETENYFGVRHEDILGPQRSQNISYPRQVAMYLCRSLTGASFPSIGSSFGGKDHSTVCYACDNIEKRRQLAASVDNDVKRLLDILVG